MALTITTPVSSAVSISDLFTKSGRAELLNVPAIQELGISLWKASNTLLGYNTPAVQRALLENAEIQVAMDNHLESVVATYSYTDKEGTEFYGAAAIQQAMKRCSVLYTTAKGLGQAFSEAEKAELVESGEYVSTGVNGQVLTAKQGAELLATSDALRKMGINTTPNASGLGKARNIVI
jgi:hypothetical protein